MRSGAAPDPAADARRLLLLANGQLATQLLVAFAAVSLQGLALKLTYFPHNKPGAHRLELLGADGSRREPGEKSLLHSTTTASCVANLKKLLVNGDSRLTWRMEPLSLYHADSAHHNKNHCNQSEPRGGASLFVLVADGLRSINNPSMHMTSKGVSGIHD
ncbi:conserved hypothetical protein [Coccidioides posadasii str. Silveira]|uniref:Uncharacterized protein n=1 Tax=Coccidioides posadasii (strain RMSCC 757 / Silveira) TaxID=443226 RepID=E9CU55_COCPS|nr:conserved hypothetical protein [Coccidioides posadasii str. Silveira]